MKRLIKLLAVIMAITVIISATPITASAATNISTLAQLKTALQISGYYIVQNDISLTSDLYVKSGANVTLYATGSNKRINVNNYSIIVSSDAQLKIGDLASSNYTSNIMSTSTTKPAVNVKYGGIFIIYHGAVVGGNYCILNNGATGISNNAVINGGNICSVYNDTNGIFKLYSGSIYPMNGRTGVFNLGDFTQSSGQIYGGGCGVSNHGTFNLKGGTISSNPSGGTELAIDNYDTLIVTGGRISDCSIGIFNHRGSYFSMTNSITFIKCLTPVLYE